MDIDYGAIFGIEPAAEEAAEQDANVQESVQPAETEEAQGSNEQEVAEPAAEESSVQSPEVNARFAAARRKAEQERDAAIAEAQRRASEDADKRIDDYFRNSGLINPYTKKPITNKAEFEEYKTRYEDEQKSSIAKKAGMSEEEFDQYIRNTPQVRAAEEAQRRAADAQATADINSQIAEIGKLDPNIKSLADLAKLPTYPKIYAYVRDNRLSILDAYRLCNADKLTASAVEASRQSALNSAQSKSHLSATQSRGSGSLTVPEEVMREYRMFNPDATDAEITAHYNRNHKS